MPEKRTYADRSEYMKIAVIKRRKKLKLMAVKYKGGKCNVCGYDKCIDALEFHHINDADKRFGISADGITRAWAITQKELDKCVMLCANCHRELHKGILQPSLVIEKCKTR